MNFKVMRKASIISIGNEILSGQTVDINASYLSGKLFSIGIPVVSFYTIGDDVDLIVRTMNFANDDADVVLMTGGLGPTDDDLTRQAFAKFLSVGLELQMSFWRRYGVFLSGAICGCLKKLKFRRTYQSEQNRF